MIVYHGSYWQRPDNPSDNLYSTCFVELDSGYNDMGVVYASSGEGVAENFAKRATAYNDCVKVVFKGNLVDGLNVVEYDGNPYVDVEGSEYHVAEERDELYAALQQAGYDCFRIADNYPEGDDISLFCDSHFEIEEVKLLMANGEWTEYVSVQEMEKLHELFVMCLPDSADPDLDFDNGMSL